MGWETMNASAPAIRPPLSAIHRYFEVSLYLLLGTSMLTLVSTGKLDLVSTLVPPAVLIFKAIRYWRGHGPELSQSAATRLAMLYLLFFPLDVWIVSRDLARGAPNPTVYGGLLAAIHLMLFAALVRLLSARETRDYLFLATLAFGMMLVSAILTVDTTFVVALLVFLALGVSTFVGLEMRRSAERSRAPAMETGTAPGKRLHRALAVTSLTVAASALTLGALIFLVIPRFTAGYLGGLNLQPSLITGFSDDVELGQIGEIKKSSAVVMRIRVEGDPGRAQAARWRGIGFTTFDGRRWYTGAQEPSLVLAGAGGWYLVGPEAPPRHFFPLRYTVLLEPLATDAVFAANKVSAIRGDFAADVERPGRPRRSYLLVDKTGSISNPYHNFARMRYEALSYVPVVPPAELRAASSDYPDDVRRVYLQLPSLDPRIPRLAGEVTATARTPYDKAAALESYFHARFGYTLELASPPKGDPLAYFLFERRAGHCEYFAAAMTVMLRALGIPARYVNGFLPGEYNDIGGDYIVRASDAHSWVEVYFPGYGWLPFDPTPPAKEKPGGWLARLGLYWDWLELTWNEWVINYDFAHQVTLAQNLQRASHEWTQRARNYLEINYWAAVDWVARAQRRASNAPYALPGALAFFVAIVFALRGRALGRFLAAQWQLRFAGSDGLTPQLATLHYQRMLRLLARRGWRKRPGQTAQEFAAAVSAPEIARPVAQLTEVYQSARFGARPADAVEMSVLLAAIKNLLRSRLKRA